MSLPVKLAPTESYAVDDEQSNGDLVLGVDIGKSSAFAAVSWLSRPETAGIVGDKTGQIEVVALEEETAGTTSALYVDEQGYLLTGELAQDGSLTAPERMITGFHQRIGDETPLIINSGQFWPESLSAVLLEWIIELTSQRCVAEPDAHNYPAISQLVVTYPGEWGRYRKELLWSALHRTLAITPALASAISADPEPDSETATPEGSSRSIALIAQPIAAARGFFVDPPPPVGTTIGVWDPDPTGSSLFLLRMNPLREWEILSHQEISPADSVEELVHQGMNGLLGLARRSEINLGSLFGTVLYGSWSGIPSLSETAQAKFPCRILSHSDSDSLAAKGAATAGRSLQVKAISPQEHPAEQTIVLPRLSLIRDTPREEQPERPPVSVTPFSPTKRKSAKGGGKKWLSRKGKASTLALIPAISLGMVLGLPGQLSHPAGDQLIQGSTAHHLGTTTTQGVHQS